MSEPFVGEIRIFAGTFAPSGWAFCDGQILSIAQNQALFSLLGTMYGGDGRTTFALPDLRGRVPMHKAGALGERGGSETVVLGAAQIPGHTHTLRARGADGDRAAAAGNVWARSEALGFSADPPDGSMHAAALASAGASEAHENMMPFLGVSFIIALFGLFPSRN